MAHFEKTLSSETRFEGRVFTVTVDKVELENGRTSTREVVHHHGGACIAALTDENEVYLVRQFRYASGRSCGSCRRQAGKRGGPLCRRQAGAGRGMRPDRRALCDLGPVYPTVGYCSEIIYCWAATGLAPCDMHLDEDEFLTPEKVPFDKAVEMVLSGEIRDGKTVAALLKIKALRDAGKL